MYFKLNGDSSSLYAEADPWRGAAEQSDVCCVPAPGVVAATGNEGQPQLQHAGPSTNTDRQRSMYLYIPVHGSRFLLDMKAKGREAQARTRGTEEGRARMSAFLVIDRPRLTRGS